MLPIFPEESPSSDWRRDREPLPEAVVAGVPPALWLIPQPTRLPLQTRAAVDRSLRRRYERGRLHRHYLTSSKGLLDPPCAADAVIRREPQPTRLPLQKTRAA